MMLTVKAMAEVVLWQMNIGGWLVVGFCFGGEVHWVVAHHSTQRFSRARC